MSNYKKIIIDNIEYLTLTDTHIKTISEKKYKRMMEKSGMDTFYWDINFKDYQGTQSLKEVERIKKYARLCHLPEMDYVHLYLYGKTSVQKTSLAYNVGKHAIRHGMKVKRVLAGELINLLMTNQGFGFEKVIYNQLQEIMSQDMLILDDCFDKRKSLMWTTANKDMIVSEWDTFFRKILASKTRVIITSNANIEHLKLDYGNSFYELIDRNTIQLQLLDSVKDKRKKSIEGKL